MSDSCQDEERNAFATLERVQVRLSDLLQRAQLALKTIEDHRSDAAIVGTRVVFESPAGSNPSWRVQACDLPGAEEIARILRDWQVAQIAWENHCRRIGPERRKGSSMSPVASTPDPAQPGVLRVFNSREETRKYYDRIARIYDLMADYSEAPARQAGLDLLAVQAGERVLEIGFGTGHCLVALARSVGPAGKVYGIDIADAMCASAEENLKKAGLADRAELTCGDGLRLAYSTGTQDAVFMSFTLELFDTPEIPLVLAECKRVLRPCGRIAVVGMSKDEGHGIIFDLYEWTHKHFPNFVDCRPIFVANALKEAGFRIEKQEHHRIWVPVEVVLAIKDRGEA
jgi:ubiquinone/menaquinone biosynthesis C-methylase UbiE